MIVRIVYQCLLIYNTKGCSLTWVSGSPGTRFPSVSPDGKYRFFTGFAAGGHEDFYRLDVRVLEDRKKGRNWSPNTRTDGAHRGLGAPSEHYL